MRRWPALWMIVCLAGLVGTRIGLERTVDNTRDEQELMYLPNGDYLRAISFGHPTLMADLVYLWAIQYYSDYENSDRYRYVDHIFGKVIAKLDPHYTDAYWVGALILIIEADQLDQGLALLDQGIEANPQDWLLPYMAGWECHGAGRYEQAAAYFHVASGRAAAPTFVQRMRAGMLAKSGDLEGALKHWTAVLNSAGDDERAVNIAERQVRNLQIRVDVGRLRTAIEAYRSTRGGPPRRLEELVAVGLIPVIPLDPDGQPYAYDSAAGSIDAPALSGLLDTL